MTLYLTYRPQDFDSLVGQNFIKESLQTAVQNNKTVWAYLFTWPRGTGKTSTARIFAKAINCLHPKNGNPCAECEICAAFKNGSLIDIIEIDAASYTWVDNIREIIERAQFQPTLCKYKVYIIDEVHMLSKWAFNALLKILEEPPKHVKFILATTDVHKVPETILSRCQRFDFRSISSTDMRARLEYVAEEEWVSIDNESLDYIISEARGWLRNALTLFEQLIVDGKISFSHIEATLWVTSSGEKEAFLQKILTRDTSLLSDYDALLAKWKNPSMFIKEVLFLLQKKAEDDLIAKNNISHHIEILDILAKLLASLKYSFDEALLIKIALLKILSGYREPTGMQTQLKNISLPQTSKVQTPSSDSRKQAVSQAQKTAEDQEIWITDIEDIFWWENMNSDSSRAEKPTPLHTHEHTLDIPRIIEEVKKLWAKAAFTMSIKGSTLIQDGEVCTVQTKTKIAREQLSKTENKTLLLDALQKLSTDINSIIIK